MLRPTLLLPLLLLVPACDAASSSSLAVVPNLAGGKADVADRVEAGAPLQFEAAVTGVFNEDLQFFGHPLEVRAGAEVRLDVTHLGTAAKLDTTMFVYGPRNESGGYGTEAIAFDDDAGWGRHSRLDMVFDEAGEYLVVLGTHDGRGRGHYRLLTTCDDEACGPEPEPVAQCHPWVRGRILACFGGQYADAASDPEVGTPSPEEVVSVCTDGEALGPIFDQTCGFPDAPEYCEGDFETFVQTVGQACAQELAPYAVECVFGSTYRELFASPDLAVSPIRVLTPASSLDGTEQAQVLAAVRSASFSEVTTLAEAFEAADGQELNQILVWDKTSATAYVVYEFGAGDTSVGAYFEAGSDVPVAVNGDGDLEFCSAGRGVMNNACSSDDDCSAGACTGVSSDSGMGRCLDTSAPGGGESCSVDDPCDLGAGLMCAGLSRTDVGMCLPAWMRGNFPFPVEVLEIPDAGTVELPIAVDGLATVDMDVEVDMVVRHPDPSQLRITLVNPDGNELVVFDGTGGEPYYTRIRGSVSGFSGDESVNGTWTLRAVDQAAGDEGLIEEASLRIGSRWD